MAKHPQNCITLEELLREVMPLLSLYVRNTIVEIQAFTDLAERALKSGIPLQRNICWKELTESLNKKESNYKGGLMDISEMTIVAQSEVKKIKETIASAGNVDMNVLLMHITNLERVVRQMQKYYKENK
jgi:endo-1,4-beta-mannosidase